MARFRTMARAVDLLGKNQIADLPTAITEIWKNGYDAYGDKLCADMFKPGCGDITRDIFAISDALLCRFDKSGFRIVLE